VMEKIFVLGVGAQKSGTTWLHDYLNAHPQSSMGLAKEYHVFDALNVSEPGLQKRFLQRRINMLFQGLEKLRPMDRLITEFLGDTQRYYDYFSDLLKPQDITLAGDITPSYCALPEHVLIEIRDEFLRRGIRVKVVFLMRDPVERIISAAKHVVRRTGETFVGRCYYGQDPESVLRELYRTPAFVMRSRYDQTVARLERVFSPEDVAFFFYETLFQEASVRELCSFLKLSYIPVDFGRRVNEAPNDASISEGLRREVYEFYKPVYDYISERFGASYRGLWGSY
jgi:hypothetical protein